MKISVPIQNDYISEQYAKNVETTPRDQANGHFAQIQQEMDELAAQPAVATNELLSSKEQSTLHMLFGSEQPADFTFYNRNQVNLINRGHLLDVKG